MKTLPYVVGLTGGIGSGKSTVSRFFSKLGADVIDADIISRELVAPGTPALAKIIEHFGPDILQGNALNRTMLGEIVFSRPEEKQWLENLLHPMVRKRIRNAVENASSSYVVLDVPLLLESNDYDYVDTILVVDCPIQVQVERVMARDGISEEQVLKIIGSQMSRETRLAHADEVVRNDGDIDRLRQEVRKLHEEYRKRSQRQES